ncbi:MAG: hypothetical protein JW904_14195 [Spirochaetales bacterium]|nr:hypothetical protein [Spirochaetales bacterium]
MKQKKHKHETKKPLRMKANIKSLLKEEGKMIHGTYGKPSRGARGNKKY